MYVSLHAHSIFSALDGHALIKDYVATIKAQGHTHAALTDHGTMAGIPSFVDECIKQGIAPIIGMEAYVEPVNATLRNIDHDHQYHLTMLAMNAEGYQNLMALSTYANGVGFYRKPRVDHNMLTKHNAGLIILSGCTSSELASTVTGKGRKDVDLIKTRKDIIEFYKETFKDRYFLEWQNHGPEYEDQHKLNELLYSLSASTGLKSVATNDSHYCLPEESFAQKLLLGVKMRKSPEDIDLGSIHTYVRTNREMVDAFGDSNLLRNTLAIASMVESYPLGTRTPKLAQSPLECEGETPTQTLSRMVIDGLHRRLGEIPASYKERFDIEIDVIEKLSVELGADFSRYILMIADICQFCLRESIRFGPRGSAAGSLICWALQISEPDPIKDGLYFERFLNPFRVEMPDVDLDFADDRRHEVFEYIKNTYGEENVAKIGTYSLIGTKQAIQDAAASIQHEFRLSEQHGKIIGGHLWHAEQINNLIPHDPRPGGIPLHELREEKSGIGKPLDDWISGSSEDSRLANKVVDRALMLEGRMRGDGMHAAGVVISNTPIHTLVPLAFTNDARKGLDTTIPFRTQYEMEYMEKLGLLKVDILGLKTLSILDRTLGLINKDCDEFIPAVDPWNIPWDDEPTWELIRSGKNLSLFQIGAEGLGGACFQLQPRNINDLALTVAVYRPGPMQNFSTIVERKNHGAPIESIHPSIDHIMLDTYGFPIYQEQIMEIAKVFAGYTLGEADLLRKAIGKKLRDKMAEERTKFMAGARRNGHSEEDGSYLWGFIGPFADYSFNKAHAICYAYVAYQTAYLKCHYPQAFYTSALTVESTTGGKETPQMRVGALIREARSVIPVFPPSIQKPCVLFEAEGDGIRYGLSCIKDVGLVDAESITKARADGGSFKSVADVLERTRAKRTSLETLIKVGAMDDILHYNRKTMTEKFEHIGPRGGRKTTTTIGLMLDQRSKNNPLDYTPQYVPEYTVSEKLAFEQDHLGMFITAFPDHDMDTTSIKEIRDNLDEYDGRSVLMMGVLTQVRHTVAKKSGQTMGYAKLLDESDNGWDLIIFHRTYETIKHLLTEGKFVYISGTIKGEVGNYKMFVDSVTEIVTQSDEVFEVDLNDVVHTITSKGTDAINELAQIFELAELYPGQVKLTVEFGTTREEMMVSESVIARLKI